MAKTKISTFTHKKRFCKKSKLVRKSYFSKENQYSDTTIFSSTFKVGENKVVSEVWFEAVKKAVWALFGYF